MRNSGSGAQVLSVEEDQRRGGMAWMLAAQMRQRGHDGSRLDSTRPWAQLGSLGLFFYFLKQLTEVGTLISPSPLMD
jgi:hypothetical protein